MRFYFVLIATLYFSITLIAQVQISISSNLDRQPIWGPTGYDYVEYYYLPDIDAYYYVPQQRFYYYEGSKWIYKSSLPSLYHDYNLYSSYKIVVNEREPWRNHKYYREKYSSYKGRHDQQLIRDSRDSKYFVNKNHPEHNNWVKQQKNSNSNSNKGTNSKVGKKDDNQNNNRGKQNNSRNKK
jgi:hypothetical protein